MKAESASIKTTFIHNHIVLLLGKIEGRGWIFSFSSSTGYKQVHNGTSMYRRSYVSSVAKCLLYHASIKRLATVRVTDEFYRAVNNLPRTPDDTEYLRLISVFGTHYASSIDMGSKAVTRSEFEGTAWTKMEQENFNFKAGAQASFLGFTGGLQYSTETDKQLAETFDSNRTSLVATYMGCRPSSDGKWETWMESTSQSPYPIAYTIRPLTELLTPQYFPNISVGILADKRANLNATYNVYCRGSPGCVPPDPDRVPIKMDRPDSAVIGTGRISCRSGMSLLTCGLGNLPFSTRAEPRRCAVPVDSKSCECFADNGAICQPWCTNVVLPLERKVSGFTKGDFGIECSKDKKVNRASVAFIVSSFDSNDQQA
jgi:hypothetical protein